MRYRIMGAILLVSALSVVGTSQIKETRIDVNTIGEKTDIRILLVVNTSAGYEVDDEQPTKGKPWFDIRSLNDDKILISEPSVQCQLSSRAYALELILSGLGKDLIENLSDGRTDYYLHVQDTVIVNLLNASRERRELPLSPQTIREKTAGKIKLTDRQAEMILGARQGVSYLYENRFDIGKKADLNDSSRTSYIATFTFVQPFLFSNNMFSATGSLGTDTDDPLNKVSIYPLGYVSGFILPSLGYPAKIKAVAGFEASQNMDVRRASVSVSIQMITPNVINLAYGENRLRLKPVLNLGVNGLSEVMDKKINRKKDNNVEVFADLYYYVPVLKIYSLLVEGNAYWINDGSGQAKGKLDITLGADIEGTGFKVMAKYSTGQNDVNVIKDSRLVLGLLMDLFERK